MVQRFHAYMLQRAADRSDDRGSEVTDRQIEAIFTAADTGDTQAIMGADAGGTIQMRDAHYLQVRIYDMEPVRSNRTDLENSNGYYVSSNATVLGGPRDLLTRLAVQPGDKIVLQTGADLVMAKLRAFEANGDLPVDVQVTPFRTQSGFNVLKLTPLPETVTAGD